MKIKSLYHAIDEGLQICKDYKNFCTQQERETEQAKRRGYVLTAEKRQEMDSKREFNRKSALKQLDVEHLLTIFLLSLGNVVPLCGFYRMRPAQI